LDLFINIELGEVYARVLLFSSISISPLLHSRSFINLVVILKAGIFSFKQQVCSPVFESRSMESTLFCEPYTLKPHIAHYVFAIVHPRLDWTITLQLAETEDIVQTDTEAAIRLQESLLPW